MWRTDSLEKPLMRGQIGGRRRRGERGWDGWMASPTRWTWVWVSSGSWWWTRKPGVLQSLGSQRLGHDWVTELKIAECIYSIECSVTSVVSDSLQPYGLYPSRHPCHGILQARILLWVGIPFSKECSQTRDQTHILLHPLRWQVGSLLLAPPG